MIEYKTERVDPAYEDPTLEINATFGWQLIESQEVYNESTRVTGATVKSYGAFMQGYTGKDGRVDLQTQTNVTNYIAMRFGRDTQMPGYGRLKELESQFYSYTNVVQPKKPVKRTAVAAIGTILIIISVIMAIAQGTAAEAWEIAVCVLFPVIFIPAAVFGWISYRKKTARYNTAIDRATDILGEARDITDGNG